MFDHCFVLQSVWSLWEALVSGIVSFSGNQVHPSRSVPIQERAARWLYLCGTKWQASGVHKWTGKFALYVAYCCRDVTWKKHLFFLSLHNAKYFFVSHLFAWFNTCVISQMQTWTWKTWNSIVSMSASQTWNSIAFMWFRYKSVGELGYSIRTIDRSQSL